MVKKYKSIKNWESKNFDTIIDVRSPSEFANDHIIGAINCPVLSDQEREKVYQASPGRRRLTRQPTVPFMGCPLPHPRAPQMRRQP